MKLEITVSEVKEIFKTIEKPEQFFEMIRFNVRETVGQYLSEMMKAELTNFLGRDRYVRGTGESNHRNGSYDRNFTLKGVGEVQVNVPRDRNGDFQTQVIPRSKQYEEEISRDLSLLFLSGVSTRSLSMISLRLLGRKISPTEISSANAELSEAIEKWRMRDLSRVLPPMLNGPILFDLVVPVKVAGLRYEGSTSPILGLFKGTARGGQKGTDYFLAFSCCDSCSRQDGPSMLMMME